MAIETVNPTSATAASLIEEGAFDNQFTRQFGVPSERVQKKVLTFLNEEVQAFIRQAPFAVLATSDAQGRCDASPKGGEPGFIVILDERHLLLPDVAGNRLFQSYQNVVANPHVGLLFMIPGIEWTVRVNGRAQVITGEDAASQTGGLAVQWRDDNTKLLQGLLIEVEEAYRHCPRAYKFADLWDIETIEANRQGGGPAIAR